MARKVNRTQFDIRDAKSSRAIFQTADEFALVRVELTDAKGDVLELEMTIHTARKLIEQMSATYYAIVPPLRNQRSDYRGY